MELAPGLRLGRYEVVSYVGAGGMGEVYKARDPLLDRVVAVKVLSPRLTADERIQQRFRREARAISSLNHPQICALYDIGEEDGRTFLVLQYLEGETLQARLAKESLSLAEALLVAAEIAAALQHAHRAGIVHRDLKPANIMLTADGAKLLDFGLAKSMRPLDPDAPTAALDPSLTSGGAIVGTVQYMAPEQIEGKPVDHRTDLFAFGVVLFEMLTGLKAFSGVTQASVMAGILERPVPLVSTIRPETPATLDRLVASCLMKAPEQRCGTIELVIEQLQSLKNATPVRHRAGRKTTNSLVVLPFVNASHDPNAEYLSEGITESLINGLSQISGLRVIARTSAFRYKDRQADPIAVGRELNVRAVLTGKVLQRDDVLVVQAELLDVGRESQVWGSQYNRKLADVFAVQEEIAQEILEKLRLKVTKEDRRRLIRRPTKTADVYQLYLRGRFHMARRTAPGIQTSIDYFQKAVDADPEYALAYAGLADAYILLNFFGFPAAEAGLRAKAAAATAVQLDDRLVEGHTALALATYLYDWDWPRAEQIFHRALELNRGYYQVHDWYGIALGGVGRFDDAIAQMERGLEIDPLSLILRHHIAWQCILARDYDRALSQCQATLDMEPNFGFAHLWLGKVYALQGRHEAALIAAKKAASLLPESLSSGVLGYALAVGGNHDDAEMYLRHLEQSSAEQYIEPYNRAAICAGLGDRERTLAWLERAFAERSIHLACFVTGDPWFDSVRGDARFQRIAAPFSRIG